MFSIFVCLKASDEMVFTTSMMYFKVVVALGSCDDQQGVGTLPLQCQRTLQHITGCCLASPVL